MSKLGIQSVKYSKMDENGKYTGAKEIGTLVTFNGSPNKIEAEDWGDNRAVESNKSVNKINLSMELNDLAGAEYADLCGHTYDNDRYGDKGKENYDANTKTNEGNRKGL